VEVDRATGAGIPAEAAAPSDRIADGHPTAPALPAPTLAVDQVGEPAHDRPATEERAARPSRRSRTTRAATRRPAAKTSRPAPSSRDDAHEVKSWDPDSPLLPTL